MSEVELKNVSKIYDGTARLVKGVNLSVYNNEFVVFVCPSGFGNSTTLRIIAGLEDITGGRYLLTENFKKYYGKELTLGIRPEGISASRELFFNDKQKIEAVVEVTEQMGNEILIYFNIGDNRVVARIDPRANIKVNEKADLIFNLSKLYFFDNSGSRIN
jgi:ABC-type sugar transport system ATPase subunit